MNVQFLYEQHEYLVQEAIMRGITEAQLVRRLLEVVTKDKMIGAILDDLPANAIVPEPRPRTRGGYSQYMRRVDREQIILKSMRETIALGIKWSLYVLEPTVAGQAKWLDALAELRRSCKIRALPRTNRSPIFYELCTLEDLGRSTPEPEVGPTVLPTPSPAVGPAPVYDNAVIG